MGKKRTTKKKEDKVVEVKAKSVEKKDKSEKIEKSEKKEVIKEKGKSKRAASIEKVVDDGKNSKEKAKAVEKEEVPAKKVKKAMIEITNLEETLDEILLKSKNYDEVVKNLQKDYIGYSLTKVMKNIAFYEEKGILTIINNTYNFSKNLKQDSKIEKEEENGIEGEIHQNTKSTPSKSTKKSGKKSAKKGKESKESNDIIEEADAENEEKDQKEEGNLILEEEEGNYDILQSSLLDEGKGEVIN